MSVWKYWYCTYPLHVWDNCKWRTKSESSEDLKKWIQCHGNSLGYLVMKSWREYYWISGVTPMGSGWANPRAPGLRGHPKVPYHSGAPPKIAIWIGAPFWKGYFSTTFPTLVVVSFFFIVWLQNSHYDAFHLLMNSKLFGCPYNWREGGTSHMQDIRDVRPKLMDFTHTLTPPTHTHTS